MSFYKEDLPQVGIAIAGGVGVSLVSPPRELVYGLLKGILVDFSSSPSVRTLDATVKDIQVGGCLQKIDLFKVMIK